MERSPRLPVPDIRDDVFQHSFKQVHRRDDSNRLRPPKLKSRYHHDSNYSRSHSSASMSATPHAISFRSEAEGESDGDTSTLSSAYNPTANETYFEQCFTTLGKLGEGSFGEVFKVRCKEDGLLYAVKMSKQLFRSENYRQERLEEVRRYEQFSGQANCVRFYRAWEQDDRLYMQMELCRESLEHYLEKRRSLPEESIWCTLLDLLLALKSLHDRNLIHLDIKLDNVLIGDDDSCKLADFGLVIDVDRANRHQATEGDSRYMAPEIMQGKFSKAADIFSLGIAMLELSCCLDLPSNGPLWQQLRSGVLPQEFINSISPELQTIIKQMMSPDPQTRPTVDQLLAHKKFVSMLHRRKRWEFFRKMNISIRKTRRTALSKLCNLRYMVFRFLTYLVSSLKLREPIAPNGETKEQKTRHNNCERMPSELNEKTPIITHIISSTPTTADKDRAYADFLINEKSMDLSQQGPTSNFATENIVNSTPVNHNNHSFRSRKDLTKTSFKTLEDVDPVTNNGSGGFLNLDDIETRSQSFTRKPLEVSSLRGKKLFALGDDSD